MSAYLVESETLHRVVDAIATFAHTEARELGYRVADADHNHPRALHAEFTRLGQDLWEMNRAAVNDRYRERQETPTYAYRSCRPAGTAQLLKSVDCLLYQCSEGSVPKRPLYKMLERACAVVAYRIASNTPEYRQAVWG
ncbi:MAG: hypothetical protein U1E45_16415 [Geminicoccaceae bacterium]